jgi:GGDEF domain-containing protein
MNASAILTDQAIRRFPYRSISCPPPPSTVPTRAAEHRLDPVSPAAERHFDSVSPTPDTGENPPTRLARAARAAEELTGALWEAIHEELSDASSPQTTDAARLAERLAEVCAALAALAARPGPPPGPEPELEIPLPEPELEIPLPEPELEIPLPESALEPPLPPETPEIEIHDARREGAGESPARSGGEGLIAWAKAIGDRVERHTADALPFAVLLVEVAGLERLAQAESPDALDRLAGRIEEALRPELRPTDAIVREGLGRWWVTASRTDVRGARTIAERLVRTARTVASHHGVPLELAIGVAVCPVDGTDSATLAAHADIGLYAARASGQPVAPVDDAA